MMDSESEKIKLRKEISLLYGLKREIDIKAEELKRERRDISHSFIFCNCQKLDHPLSNAHI